MCSRFRSIEDFSQLPRDMPPLARLNWAYNPNVAPTETSPLIIQGGDGPELKLGEFGIRKNAPDGKRRGPLLNARTDSIKRGSFRSLVAGQRCIIPALGFYEWREEQGRKQPYFFYRRDGEPILFVGIWDWSQVKSGEALSFAILTDDPNELVAPYHDRMPFIVDEARPWLEGTALTEIRPLGPEAFAVRPVNPAVNKVSEKSIEAIEAWPAEEQFAKLVT